jgi:hypothetical protein
MANMQQFVRGALLDELPVARSQPAVATGNEPKEEFSAAELQQLAIDHASRRLSWKGKQAKAELRAAGFDPAVPKQREFYLTAYFAQRRRVLGSLTAKAS